MLTRLRFGRWRPLSFASKLCMLAWWDGRGGSPGGDHIMAPARVIGPISNNGGDLLIPWDLLQQVRQYRGIADIAFGDADRAYLKFFHVYAEMKLAPHEFLGPAMFARVLLSFIPGLDPGSFDQQVEKAPICDGGGWRRSVSSDGGTGC